MKKNLLILMIVSAVVLSFPSCTRQYIDNSLPGLSFYIDTQGGTEWRESSDNVYESYLDIALPQLDGRYFEDGHVDVSLGIPGSGGSIVEFVNIPGTYGRFKYNVRYAVGRVRILVTDLQASNPSEVQVPGPQTLKIVLTDADIGN